MSSFCNAKATHIFATKNINLFENTLATTVNEFVIKELVKLMMLRTTGLFVNLMEMETLSKKAILSKLFYLPSKMELFNILVLDFCIFLEV